MTKVYSEPDPLPPNPTPAERRRFTAEQERFLTEGMKPGVSQSPAKIDATDQRIRLLRAEHTRFLEHRNPFKAALWLELMRPEKEVIHDAEQARRFEAAQQGALGKGVAVVAPERPAIIGLANRLVAAGLRGDTAAMAQIADRIEGKAGLRAGDEPEDDPERKKQSAQIAESILRRLTETRLGDKPEADAKIVDVDVEVVDKPSKDR